MNRTPTILTLTLLSLLFASGSAAAKPLTVLCKTEVSTFSWYPLRLEVIARITEGRVLQQLTRGGGLTLKPKGHAAPADIDLKINARIIEDAGQFSVFVSATPKKKDRLGSFAAVSTRSILKMKHRQIQQKMEQAATEAGKKLMALLGPRLRQLTGGATVPLGADTKLPLSWGGGLFKARKNPRALASLQDVMSRAAKEAGARRQLAQCASSGGGQWSRCVAALGKLARRQPFAQRAIIAMLVQEPPADKKQWSRWKKARREAFKVSTTFDGPALSEAVQAWLLIFGADRSHYGYYLFGHSREDYFVVGSIARYLQQTPNVPNLDIALARCSRPSKDKGKPPEGSCLKVLKTISPERRIALLYRQLVKPPRYSSRAGDSRWGAMLKVVVDRDKPLHPMVTKICVNMLRRGFWWRDRADCAEAIGRGAKPTKALADVMLNAYLTDKKLAMYAGEAMWKLAQREPGLCRHFEKKLAPYIARRAYPDYKKSYSGKVMLPRVIRNCERERQKKRR